MSSSVEFSKSGINVFKEMDINKVHLSEAQEYAWLLLKINNKLNKITNIYT